MDCAAKLHSRPSASRSSSACASAGRPRARARSELSASSSRRAAWCRRLEVVASHFKAVPLWLGRGRPTWATSTGPTRTVTRTRFLSTRTSHRPYPPPHSHSLTRPWWRGELKCFGSRRSDFGRGRRADGAFDGAPGNGGIAGLPAMSPQYAVPSVRPLQPSRHGCVACKPPRDTPEPSAALVQAGVGESCRGYCKNNGYDCDEVVYTIPCSRLEFRA